MRHVRSRASTLDARGPTWAARAGSLRLQRGLHGVGNLAGERVKPAFDGHQRGAVGTREGLKAVAEGAVEAGHGGGRARQLPGPGVRPSDGAARVTLARGDGGHHRVRVEAEGDAVAGKGPRHGLGAVEPVQIAAVLGQLDLELPGILRAEGAGAAGRGVELGDDLVGPELVSGDLRVFVAGAAGGGQEHEPDQSATHPTALA